MLVDLIEDFRQQIGAEHLKLIEERGINHTLFDKSQCHQSLVDCPNFRNDMLHICWQVHAIRYQLFFKLYCILQVRNLLVNFRYWRGLHRLETLNVLILHLFIFFDCHFVASGILLQVANHFYIILDHLLLCIALLRSQGHVGLLYSVFQREIEHQQHQQYCQTYAAAEVFIFFLDSCPCFSESFLDNSNL